MNNLPYFMPNPYQYNDMDKILKDKIMNLEKIVKELEKKIKNIEDNIYGNNNSYQTNYQPNSYNMM